MTEYTRSAVSASRYKLALLLGSTLIGSTALGLSQQAWSQDKGTVPDDARKLALFSRDWTNLPWISDFGKFTEIRRASRKPMDTKGMNLLPVMDPEREFERLRGEVAPEPEKQEGSSVFEFLDIGSMRSFQYEAKNADLTGFSRLVSEDKYQNSAGDKAVPEFEIRLEEARTKSWSNSTDNRIRRGIADGYSDTNSIYQSIANYGGCSANILSANSTRMVAITAAHCIFRPGNVFSSSKIEPRADGGSSPTWGRWTPYAFGYYPAYINNDCEDNWRGSHCIKHDIALIIAQPDNAAQPPRSMGWGYQNKNTLDQRWKYRRGYPGCSWAHSPLNCNTDTLYGDGSLSVGNFSKLDQDNWNRQIRFSSDVNPGDSGSGLYYYNNNFPYVFAVTSAEPSSCDTNCTSSRPNYARRITPQFFNFINTVVF